MSAADAGQQQDSMLASGEHAWAGGYGSVSQTADFIVTNGVEAMRFVVTHLTAEEAQNIAEECERLTDWSAQTFHDMVNRVLGGDYLRVN